MSLMELIMDIVVCLIAMVICIGSYYGVQWAKLFRFLEMAIRSAEQLYSPEEWRSKKIYVTGYIKELIKTTLHIHISDADLDILIEGMVNKIKHVTDYCSK